MRLPAVVLPLLIGVFFVSCSKKSEEDGQTAAKAAADTIQVTPVEPQEAAPEQAVPDLQEQTLSANVPTVVPYSDGRYTIQVSSWKTRSKAEREVQRFGDLGLDAWVEAADLPEMGGRWYRVRIGSFADIPEAMDFWRTELRSIVENDIWIDFAKK